MLVVILVGNGVLIFGVVGGIGGVVLGVVLGVVGLLVVVIGGIGVVGLGMGLDWWVFCRGLIGFYFLNWFVVWFSVFSFSVCFEVSLFIFFSVSLVLFSFEDLVVFFIVLLNLCVIICVLDVIWFSV